jgi:hypothetical protein
MSPIKLLAMDVRSPASGYRRVTQSPWARRKSAVSPSRSFAPVRSRFAAPVLRFALRRC